MTMHLMVDIETLGTSPNAPVIEVAVVEFDATDTFRTFTSRIRPDFRRTSPDVETIDLWMKQPDCPLDLYAPSACTVIGYIHSFYHSRYSEFIWANSPSFDLVILEQLAKAHDTAMPWTFKQWRDFRTAFSLARTTTRVKPDQAHNALSDALAQALTLIKLNHELRGRLL